MIVILHSHTRTSCTMSGGHLSISSKDRAEEVLYNTMYGNCRLHVQVLVPQCSVECLL